MTEEELSQLRSRLGVNTFGTFVDRFVLKELPGRSGCCTTITFKACLCMVQSLFNP